MKNYFSNNSNKIITICILLFVTCCLSQDPLFPKIPTTYSTYLSMNSFDDGVTYAFKEYHNEKLKKSRFESTNVTVVDWNTNTFYWWAHSNTNSTSACFYKKFNSTFPINPSYEVFTSVNTTQIKFKKYDQIDRGINCSYWESIGEPATGIEKEVPIGINVNQTNFNVTYARQFTSITTCLDSLIVADNDTVIVTCDTETNNQIECKFKIESLSAPIMCAMSDNTTFGIIQNFGTNQTIPVISNLQINYTISFILSYYLTSDTQLPVRVSSDGSKIFSDGRVEHFYWVYDWISFVATDNQQPELYQVVDGCVEDTSSGTSWDKPSNKTLLPHDESFVFSVGEFSALFEPILEGQPSDSIIWRYDVGNNYQAIEVDTSTGDLITVFNEKTSEQFSINTYTKKCKSSGVENIFKANPRNFAIYNVMTGLYNNFAFTNQTVKRGVNVDQWDGQFENGQYKYNITVYLFNRGWVFPGRFGVSNKTTIPLSIQVLTVDSNQANTTDYWDIFYYVVEDIPTNYINKESLHCLPELPVNYTSLVSVNYGEVGASFSYFETVFSERKLIYTQGKFSSFYTFSTIDLLNDVYSEWLPNSTTCKAYQIPNVDKDYFEKVTHEPSLDVFYAMAEEFGPVEYVGITTEQQFNVTQFKTTSPDLVPVIRNGIALQQNRTAYLNWVPGTSVPHSVHFIISYQEPNKPETARTFNIYVYWSMFSNIPSQLKEYTTPSGIACTNTNTTAPEAYTISQNGTTSFAPPILSNSSRVTVPNQFTAYIEVKTKQKDGSYLITPIKWQYSEQNKVETFTIYNPQNYTPSTYKYCYKTQMGGLAKLIIDNQTIGIVNSNTSPLYKIGDGQLVQLFYQPSSINSAVMSLQYKMDKGVPGETYTYSVDDSSSTYMFYPKGWILFGENITSRIPLTLTRSTKQGNITEVWNFYRFTNDIDSDINTHCDTTVAEYVGGLSGGIIAAIVIVVAVCFIGITAIVIVVVKKKRQLRQQPPHILLDDRNLINSNEINRVYEN